MIPFFEFSSINLGPVSLQVWGSLVAFGILIGTWTSARYAKRRGLNADLVYQAAFWIVLTAFFGARFVHVVFYDLPFYASNPTEIVKFWHGGFSVIGGFLGALLAYLLYSRRHAFSALQYADAFLYGLPLGLGCGRIGCFLIHDHPGTATNFFLAVKNESGVGAFHDHGLYLSINGFFMAFVFYLLQKKPRYEGFFAQIFLIWYGTVRFVLDFWRAVDTTYFGVTPAQYVSFAMALGGIIWMMTQRHRPNVRLH